MTNGPALAPVVFMESAEHTLPPRSRDEPVRSRVIVDATLTTREIVAPVDDRLLGATTIEALCVALACRGEVICVTRAVSVEALLTLLLERGISGAPVVDDGGRPVGMVSKTDLLRMQFEDDDNGHLEPLSAEQERELRARFGPGYHLLTVARATVGEVMMPVAMTLDESASVTRAAAVMVYEGIHRLPVVDTDGCVTGIVTPLDILRLLALSNGYAL